MALDTNSWTIGVDLHRQLLRASPVHVNSDMVPIILLDRWGLKAELYYVREGVVNAYAMTFVVLVPANMADLEFSWESLAGIPVSTKIKLDII
ncbi:hypothetical protein PV327_007905 [Microctonus hyperodae]|uniref:WIF domain-containing protein n=1 Tax=Microctonus hyperodae TaxID=165561 RepID=A0AA39KZ45_MICHY|nr:hypothetical protein PV327_007905 [Microctonus hyperodae]